MGTSPKLIPTIEAAQRLRVAQLTVRRWVHKGRLRGQLVGRSMVVEEPAVAAFESCLGCPDPGVGPTIRRTAPAGSSTATATATPTMTP